jgi:ABC-type multidrug transport system fused ATPase/permease subunit
VRLEEWVQREGDKLAARTGPRLGPLGSPAWGCHPEGTGAGGLQTAVSEAGGNMSVGQRQLICLAGVAMGGALTYMIVDVLRYSLYGKSLMKYNDRRLNDSTAHF